MSVLPDSGFVKEGKAPGGGTTSTPVTDAQIMAAKLVNYSLPLASRPVTTADAIGIVIGILERAGMENKDAVAAAYALANTANGTATTANTAAQTATTIANNASNLAGTANTVANNALTNAATALSAANTAASSAGSAGATASTALALAQNAAPVVNGTIPVQYFGGLLDKEIVDYPSYASFPATGSPTTIYVDRSDNNAKYEWSGTTYTPIGAGLSSVTINGESGSVFNLTKDKIGLSNVPNLDATNPLNLQQSASYRLVSDTEKTTWNSKQAALGFTPVPNTLTINGKPLSANVTLAKLDLGLGNVPNLDTSNPLNITQSADYRFATDAEKTAWNSKQAALGFTPVPNTRTIAGKPLTADVALTKTDVGLANVPNVDTSNPVNITQSATLRFVSDTEKATWNAKQAALGYTPVPNTTTINGKPLSANVALVATDVGLGNVANKTEAQMVAAGPIADALATKGGIDETLYALPLVNPTTSWVHDPNKPHKSISVDKSSKLQPTAPTGGFKELMGGLVKAVYTSAGHTLTFEGKAPAGYPDAVGGKQNGAKYRFLWTIWDGLIEWDAEYLGGAVAATTRYYAKFDNVDSYITVANSVGNNDAAGDYSFAFWAKFATSTLATPTTMILFEKGGATGYQANVQPTSTATPNYVRMGNSSATADTITTSASHADSTWRHYAFTYTLTGTAVGTLTAYVNGVQIGQKTGVAQTTVNTAALQIGARSTTTALAYGGYLSTLRMWKAALTATQVTADMNGTRNATNLTMELFASVADKTDTSPVAAATAMFNGVTYGTEQV